MAPKLIVVLGATGLQGGSVISALLSAPSGTYSIRGISRDPTSTSSQALAAKGVEMVSGDLSSPPSLTAAFQGAYAVFGVTMPFSAVPENVQGKNIVDACLACGVDLLVWSSLQDAKKISGGKYTKVKHWDAKAEVDGYIREKGQKAVILQTGSFVENLMTYHYLRPSPTPASPNKYTLAWPIIRPHVSISQSYITEDFGPCVVKCIDLHLRGEGDKLGKEPIPVCSFRMSIEEMVETLQRLTGREIEYQKVSQTPIEEINEMLMLVDEGDAFPNIEFPTRLFVHLGVKFHTFEDYVRKGVLPRMAQGPGAA